MTCPNVPIPARRLGPLDVEPVALRPPFDRHRPLIYNVALARQDRRSALLDALGPGVDLLGAYDLRMLDWLAGWDIPTVGGTCSLIYRARTAEHHAACPNCRADRR